MNICFKQENKKRDHVQITQMNKNDPGRQNLKQKLFCDVDGGKTR